ncbi:NADP-dependent oxidoreductase [Kribbella sp. CA-245084]|uniref:NADP-dependent oxidoreductase n=1 Tax=Kribbella sp. CA-245084 TaxID=3239940 RepID=UPI003D8E570C
MPLAYVFTAYGGPSNQRYLQLPRPDPGHGQVLVGVRAAGVNPVDWKVREGKHRTFLPLELPAVLGREVAGVVVAVGPGVAGHAVGDPVVGPTVGGCGGYAEFALVEAVRAARMPDGLTFTDAAVLPISAGTAYDSLLNLGVTRGETLLILGVGGGVGTMATQLAALDGVAVIGTASTPKRAFVESLGARFVAYDDGALELPPVDAVLDLVGAVDSVVLTERTRVLTVADKLPGGARSVSRRGDPETLPRLAGLVAAGKLDACVRQVFPFAEAGAALAVVEAGHVSGKVVIGLPTGPGH